MPGEVAVIGAGHGGLAAAADLSLRGYLVRLQNRSEGPLRAVREAGGIHTGGVLGEGVAPVGVATTDLREAVDGADAVVVVLPALAHAAVGRALVDCLDPDVPVVLNPGHMCGSLHLRAVFRRAGRRPPRIAELGTLSYVCRSPGPARVDVYLRARDVPVAAFPPDRADLQGLAARLFPGARPVASAVEAWLHDVNLVLHPPGMVLGAAWIEHSGGAFRFYADGVTRAVERLMAALDGERRAVGRGLGVEVGSLAEIMGRLGSADAEAAARGDLGEAVRRGEANRSIRAPAGVDHRYLDEDVPFGLVPLMALAAVAGTPTPVAEALTTVAETITGRAYRRDGLTAESLRIAGLDVESFRRLLEAEP